MRKNLLLLIVMSLFMALLLTGCGGNDTPKEPQQSGNNAQGGTESDVFRVGLECGYPPFNWTQLDDSNGAVKIDGNAEYAGGYDVEIAKRIAEGLGKELVIVKTDWDGLVPFNFPKLMPLLRYVTTAERDYDFLTTISRI